MRDRFTQAELELQDKSPFICASCGHPNDIAKVLNAGKSSGTGVHDRFSDAVLEEADKNAFVCESCGQKMDISKPTRH